jgi:hypothetical protein
MAFCRNNEQKEADCVRTRTKTENSNNTKIPPEAETLELRKNEWVCESPD